MDKETVETSVVEQAIPQQENKVEAQNQIVEEKAVEKEESQEQINWKRFREARDKERKQLAEETKRRGEKEKEAEALKAAMEALLDKKSAQNLQINDDQYAQEEETDDQKIQKRIEQALEAREKQYYAKKKEQEKAELPNKLKETFKDFEAICTQDNIDYLEYHHPELARSLQKREDSFETWADVYNAVKRYVPNTNSKQLAQKAQNNLNKPQSMSVKGMTPTGDTAPQILDDKRRADNWARMERTRKGL